MHSIGPFTWHRVYLSDDCPRFHIAYVHETNEPYRVGKSLILHTTNGNGLAVGWWKKSGKHEDDALVAAMRADLYLKHHHLSEVNSWLELPGPAGQKHRPGA